MWVAQRRQILGAAPKLRPDAGTETRGIAETRMWLTTPRTTIAGRALADGKRETMRFLLAFLIALGFMVGSAGLMKPTVSAQTYVVAADQQPPGGQVDDVDSRADRDDDWWASPFFIGAAVLALILVLITVIMMVLRGRGTTVTKS
jgi:hypothetical protein